MNDLRKAADHYIRPGTVVPVDIETTRILVDLLRQALAESANSTTDFVEPKAPSQTEQKREWVGLTDEEISQIWGCLPQTMDEEQDAINFGFAIEAKLKEKNT